MNFRDNVEHTVAAGGTGVLTLGAATSGSQAFAAGDDQLLFSYVIRDDVAIETGFGVYTHSGGTFARVHRTFSSSGAALNVSQFATLYLDAHRGVHDSLDLAVRTHICGLLVTKEATGNTLAVSPGSAYVPALGRVVSFPGAIGVSSGTRGSSQWHQTYLVDESTVEVANNSEAAAAAYQGTARQGGTGGKRRWIGPFFSETSTDVADMLVSELPGGAIRVGWSTDTHTGRFRVLPGGTSTAYQVVSMLGALPRHVSISAMLSAFVTVLPSGSGFKLSSDGVNSNLWAPEIPGGSGGYGSAAAEVPILPNVPGLFFATYSTDVLVYLDASNFTAVR